MADLRIHDPRVSRIHALLEVRGENILLTDLASSHGTFVNGEKVVEHKLKMGDTIRLGFVEVRLSKGSGKVTSTQPAFEGRPVFEGEETQVNIDRSLLEQMDRRDSRPDRRKKDAFPEEQRLDDRRQGERRVEQRQGERRQPALPGVPPALPEGVAAERRSGEDLPPRDGLRAACRRQTPGRLARFRHHQSGAENRGPALSPQR